MRQHKYTENMIALLLLFFDICRFQRSPKDIPSSILLKRISILSFLVTDFGYMLLASQNFSQAVLAVLETVLLVVFGYAAVWTRGFEDRATQTITALTGTGTLLYLILIPLLLVLPIGIFQFLLLVVAFWSIAIMGYILRHALDIGFFWGLGIAFLFTVLEQNLFAFLSMASGQ